MIFAVLLMMCSDNIVSRRPNLDGSRLLVINWFFLVVVGLVRNFSRYFFLGPLVFLWYFIFVPFFLLLLLLLLLLLVLVLLLVLLLLLLFMFLLVNFQLCFGIIILY